MIAAVTVLAFGSIVTGAIARPSLIVNTAVVKRTFATNPALAHRYFDTPSTFEIAGSRGVFPPETGQATRTVTFADETVLAAAVRSDTLPPGTRAVIFDDENWAITPLAQQLDPATYYRRAAEVAHRHGLLLIAAPGSNLAGVLHPGSTGIARFKEFLRLGIARFVARHADVFAIQAQALEPNPRLYARFVDRAAAQARHANREVEVIAGLSTNPSLPPVEVEPATVLLDAASATSSAVDGWWLNDPSNGPNCPLCVGPFPQTIVDFLTNLRRVS